MDEKPSSAGNGFLLKDNPALKSLLYTPIQSDASWINDEKIRRLYLQASSQQWFAPNRINFETPITLHPELKRIWIRLNTVFYTFEKMGLNVISNMMAKATRRLKSDEASLYLSAQCYDESRHVFAIENYLKLLGTAPKYERKYHILGQVASLGFYRVENWLFSTLFSENFASCFLRHAKNAEVDPVGSEMYKQLLIDESRHIHFLNIVLPDIFERLPLLGRTYVMASQFFIMKFTQVVSQALENDAKIVGINRKEILEESFENVKMAYDTFGIKKGFLPFPKLNYAH